MITKIIPGKYKKSRQRDKVLEILQSTDTHPTADWIYKIAKKDIKNLSLGTVYRNLNILVDQGLAKRLDFGSTYDHYDAVVDNHYHLICEKCGSIIDLEMEPDENLVKAASEKTSFKISDHRVEFFGLCKKCQ
ncbi:MAG: transcriptional repressor [Spirochaetia bacterium]|jgi:Fe2+ or Zn2+ uptake regulation protein|nr:transcriptional repressor [Spirochaetia bacterium]